MCSLQNTYSRWNKTSDQLVFSLSAQSWHRYKKRGEQRFLSRKVKKKKLSIVPLSSLHPRWVFSLHILTCVPPLSQLHLFCDSDNMFWRMSYCPAYLCGVPIIWVFLIWLSYCVSVSPVVSLKGSKLPLTFFSYWICICLLQVAEGYKYKAYYICIPLFSHCSRQVCNIVYFKYLKGLSLNKLWKVHAFHSFFKSHSDSSSARLFERMNNFMVFHFRPGWVKAGFF